MGSYATQTGNFDYQLSFRQNTGVHNWVFSLTYDEVSTTLWESPTEEQIISGGTGISESVGYSNGTLFLGDPSGGRVEVYQSEITTQGAFKGSFSKVNRVYPFGAGTASGFGSALQALEHSCIVGAPQATFGDNLEAGAIFYYNFTQTGLQGATGTGAWGQSFFVSGTEASGAFGCAFSSRLSSLTPIVGVGASGELEGSGRSYVYNGLDGSKIFTISPTGVGVSHFGKSQGACLADGLGCVAIGYEQGGLGKIDIYKEATAGNNDYAFFQTLEGADSSYGATVQGRGSTLIIGAPDAGGEGAVYTYPFSAESGTFYLSQTIQAENISAGDHFGKSFDFGDSVAVIGSDANFGSAYIFEPSGSLWEEKSQFSGSASSIDGSFAGKSDGSKSLVSDGNRAIVGTYGENDAYVFTTGLDVGVDYSGVAFSGNGNKIYDSDGNFIYGYGAGDMCVISGGVFTGGYYSIFINENLCVSRSPREAGVGLTGSLNSWSATGFDQMTHYFLNIWN